MPRRSVTTRTRKAAGRLVTWDQPGGLLPLAGLVSVALPAKTQILRFQDLGNPGRKKTACYRVRSSADPKELLRSTQQPKLQGQPQYSPRRCQKAKTASVGGGWGLRLPCSSGGTYFMKQVALPVYLSGGAVNGMVSFFLCDCGDNIYRYKV